MCQELYGKNSVGRTRARAWLYTRQRWPGSHKSPENEVILPDNSCPPLPMPPRRNGASYYGHFKIRVTTNFKMSERQKSIGLPNF